MRIRINSYNAGSASARALAESLTALTGQRVLRLREQTRFVPRADDVIINYGIPRADLPNNGQVTLNTVDAIRTASNKLNFFNYIEQSNANIRIPEFTSEMVVARGWIRDGAKVCCRTNLNGHSAQGLVLAETEEQLVQAPLYTKYVPKKHEYRVHFVGNTITDVQRKARRLDTPDEDVNWQVRNHDNGFIYKRDDVTPQTVPEDVLSQAGRTVAVLPLTFGSIDIIWHERSGNATVLEVNTASGLEGTTLERFSEALNHYINNRRPTLWNLLNDVREMQLEDQEQPEPEHEVVLDAPEEEEQEPVVHPEVQRLQEMLAVVNDFIDVRENIRQVRQEMADLGLRNGLQYVEEDARRIEERIEELQQQAQAAPQLDARARELRVNL